MAKKPASPTEYGAHRQHELIADVLDRMETDICAIRALAARGQHTKWPPSLIEGVLCEEGSEEQIDIQRRAQKEKRRARHVTPLLKFYASERAVEMARECIQVRSGFGYTREYGAEKLLRDSLVLPIYPDQSDSGVDGDQRYIAVDYP